MLDLRVDKGYSFWAIIQEKDSYLFCIVDLRVNQGHPSWATIQEKNYYMFCVDFKAILLGSYIRTKFLNVVFAGFKDRPNSTKFNILPELLPFLLSGYILQWHVKVIYLWQHTNYIISNILSVKGYILT